jgi:hypothetical protein
MTFFSRLQSTFILLIASFILIFSIYKSATTSFTHDESYTYLNYVHQNFLDIVSYKTPFTNNHILNSLGMKYSEMIFGSSELALRLPNLLALFLYLFFGYRMIRGILPEIKVPGYVVLCANPYLLDFFGLARGYGMSIGFMTTSLFFLTRYFQTGKNRDAFWFNTGAFFAVLSNFALINYYIAALVVFNVVLLLKKKKLSLQVVEKGNSLFQSNIINLTSLLATVLVIYEPFRKIIKHQFINFGGQTGFLADTVESSLVRFFYLAPIKPNTWGVAPIEPTWLVFYKSLVVLVPLAAFAILIFHMVKKNWTYLVNYQSLVITNLVLLFIVLSTILQFHLLGTQYLKERFALFLVPLFLFNLIFILDYLGRQRGGKLIAMVIIFTFAVSFLFNTFRNLNSRFYLDWKYDMATREVIEILVEEKATGHYDGIHLGANWLFSPALNFYRGTLKLEWLTEIYQHGGLGEYDHFFYEFTEDIGKQEQNLSGKEVLMTVEEIGTQLLRIRPEQ